MLYKKGEYFLIQDNNYKANKFIGEILDQKERNLYLLNVYIFPEDTKDGRQYYMSQYEVFLTSSEVLYSFDKKNEVKVEVTTIEEYISRKYISNEKVKYPLYFKRQIYCCEKNIFIPGELPLICYCQEIFNPDKPFKKCVCDVIFHPDCLLQSKSNKCWSSSCDFNCNQFLSEEEQIQKLKLLYGDIRKGIDDINTEMGKDNNNTKNLLNKKKNRDTKDENDNIEIFNRTDILSNSTELNNSVKNKDKDKEKTIDIKDEKKNKENIINKEKRERAINIIYNNLIKGKEIIKNDLSLLEKYENCVNKEIYNYIKTDEEMFLLFQLKQLSEKIEDNLYKLYSNNQSSYLNFLQYFNQCKHNSTDLLIKIIFGELSPEDVSRFTEYDFMSDEQKKKRELKKNSELNKMRIKNDDSDLIFTLNKGRMLSEKEIYNDEKNNMNDLWNRNDEKNLDGLKNQKTIHYEEKIKEKQKQFPNMNIDDVKMLLQLTEPNEEVIEKKLNDLIQENFELNEQNNFFEKRKITLEKEARKIINKEEKDKKKKIKDNIYNINDKIDKNKMENIIQDISFDIKYL